MVIELRIRVVLAMGWARLQAENQNRGYLGAAFMCRVERLLE